MLTLLGTQSCGELAAFSTEFALLGVVGDKIILREYLVHSVPPEGKSGFGAFNSVEKTEEVVEDSCDLVDSWCGDACPQVGLGGRDTGEHAAKQEVVT